MEQNLGLGNKYLMYTVYILPLSIQSQSEVIWCFLIFDILVLSNWKTLQSKIDENLGLGGKYLLYTR